MVEKRLELRCAGCPALCCLPWRVTSGPGEESASRTVECYFGHIALFLNLTMFDLSMVGEPLVPRWGGTRHSRKSRPVCPLGHSLWLHRASLLTFWSRSGRWMPVKCRLPGGGYSSFCGVIIWWQRWSLTCLPPSNLFFRDSYPKLWEFQILQKRKLLY